MAILATEGRSGFVKMMSFSERELGQEIPCHM